MIPWVREKIAEKRLKWLAARQNKRPDSTENVSTDDSISEDCSSASARDIGGQTVGDRSLTRQHLASGVSTVSILPSSTASIRSGDPPPLAARSHQEITIPCSPRSPRSTPSTPLRGLHISKKGKNRRRNSFDCPDSGSSLQIPNGRVVAQSTQKERLRVRIITPSGRVLIFLVDPQKRLSDLKNEVILELSDDPASMPLFATDVRQLSPRYRLFRGNFDGAELNETMSLAQLNITDNDMLVMVVRRSNSIQQLSMQSRDIQGPRDTEIESETRNVIPQAANMPMVDVNEIFQQSNLQFDVRKVLISLAQTSAAIIGTGPFANRLIAMLKQKLINRRSYQEDTLQALIDMGFKREKADYALKTHHGVYASALEWLLLHQNDEMPLEEASMSLQKSESMISPSSINVGEDLDIITNTQNLLDIVRIYSHRDMPPPPEAVQSLISMGFEEKDVLKALRKTCNNKAAACEWLCGNRTGSLIELRDGLAQDSPILKSILELPQVQISLSNPKIFLAFLSILENENSLRVWGGDNDTTSVITHILQKYHEEKHVMGINQFYSGR